MPGLMRQAAANGASPVLPARSGRALLAWLLVAAVAGCVFGGGRAVAATGHGFLASVSEGPPGTRLVRPGAVAVDGATGEAFVGDAQAGYVDVYSSAGAYETRFGEGLLDVTGLAVDEASGLVYVADAFMDAVLVFRPDGSGGYTLSSEWFGENLSGGEFGAVRGVAVDNSVGPSGGAVYVADGRDPKLQGGVVDVFRPRPAGPEEGREGSLLRVLGAGKLEEPNGVAVSPSTGRVLVADSFSGAVFAYSAEGVNEEKLNGRGSPYGPFAKEGEVGDVAGVAVDGVSGDVYVAEAERHVVSQYGPNGEWQGWITTTPSGGLGEPRGVALSSSGEVFVADPALGVVDRFGAAALVPSVETGKVAKSALTRTTALLSGSINGEGKAAKYRFQYGESSTLGLETATYASGGSLEAVSALVENLHPGQTYYYRIVGEDEDGANYGLIRELRTAEAVDALSTGPVQNVTPTGGMLTGSVKREGLPTHYYFQYGTSSAYGEQSPESPAEVPAGMTEKEERELKQVDAGVSGLQPNTVYHYRLVGENSYGTTYGQDEMFTTSGPPRITYQPAGPVSQDEATIHAQIDPDQLATSYRVQYGETTSYGSEASGEEIGSGSTPVAVSLTLSNLTVGTVYHFRVIAENEAGMTDGEDETFATVASAPVDATFVTGVNTSHATLHTEINPLGHDTHYYFQYGTDSCQANPQACTSVPTPPGEDIGEGTQDVAREVALSGLTPGTTYHYRVLDSNTLGMTEGPERTFVTPPERGFALPDNRAWEMVSPPDKQGAPVEALTREGGIILASEDGNAFTYVVDGALEEDVEGNRSPEWQQVLARREARGWRSEGIATPSSKAKGFAPGATPEYQFFTPDLSSALVEPATLTPYEEPPLAEGAKQATMYVRDNAAGTYLPLVTEANVASGTAFGARVHFAGATPDLRHVVIASQVALLGSSSAPGLYEWSEGALAPVSVRPNGRPVKASVELGYSHTAANAVSSDGTRIVWTIVEQEPHLGHLYMRDSASAETVQLDAAQGEGVHEPAGLGTARFQTASSDGSRVFFTDRQKLTPDSTAEPASNEPDLYECEMVIRDAKLACNLTDLSVDPIAGGHANVLGSVFGTSEDGASTYFVSRGALANNANGNQEHAIEGGDNLYEAHYDGHTWTTTFIATLSSEDSPEWEANAIANTAYVTARVSPNGRYLAFMSAAPLTGYENLDANSGMRDEEVYLYDSQTASLRCVSCNPSGARPEGVLDTEGVGEGLGLLVDRRKVWFGHYLAGNIPGWTAENLTSALYQSRYLSNSGRLYFNSPDDLVRAAENHKEDVYEYEPSAVGNCVSTTGGCVSLISSGSSRKESAFIEATPDGSNVFFVTAEQLLPQDTDTAYDIYDARECTEASPCLSPPAKSPTPCTNAETCTPAPLSQVAPIGPSGSASFSGPANMTTAPSPAAKHETKGVKSRSKPLTRAQKLTRALRSCRKRYAHSKKRRSACERNAVKRYRTSAVRSCRKRYAHSKKRRTACERNAVKRHGKKRIVKKATKTAKSGSSSVRAGGHGP
jgi:hypothetical protein